MTKINSWIIWKSDSEAQPQSLKWICFLLYYWDENEIQCFHRSKRNAVTLRMYICQSADVDAEAVENDVCIKIHYILSYIEQSMKSHLIRIESQHHHRLLGLRRSKKRWKKSKITLPFITNAYFTLPPEMRNSRKCFLSIDLKRFSIKSSRCFIIGTWSSADSTRLLTIKYLVLVYKNDYVDDSKSCKCRCDFKLYADWLKWMNTDRFVEALFKSANISLSECIEWKKEFLLHFFITCLWKFNYSTYSIENRK